MVGLSVVLENQKSVSISKKTPQVISKTSMLVGRSSSSSSFSGCRPPPPPPLVHLLPPPFPDYCCLCRQKLLPGKDIYMYQGDRAFCSVDCRCRQIFMDEQEETAQKRSFCSSSSSSSSSSAAASASASGCRRKAVRNRAGGFAY